MMHFSSNNKTDSINYNMTLTSPTRISFALEVETSYDYYIRRAYYHTKEIAEGYFYLGKNILPITAKYLIIDPIQDSLINIFNSGITSGVIYISHQFLKTKHKALHHESGFGHQLMHKFAAITISPIKYALDKAYSFIVADDQPVYGTLPCGSCTPKPRWPEGLKIPPKFSDEAVDPTPKSVADYLSPTAQKSSNLDIFVNDQPVPGILLCGSCTPNSAADHLSHTAQESSNLDDDSMAANNEISVNNAVPQTSIYTKCLNFFSSSIDNFKHEYITHAGAKLSATLFYPLYRTFIEKSTEADLYARRIDLNKATITTEATDNYFQKGLKFIAINPLEGLFAIDSIKNFTKFETIGSIKYFDLDHNSLKGEESEFIKSFNSYMEYSDGIIHSVDILDNSYKFSKNSWFSLLTYLGIELGERAPLYSITDFYEQNIIGKETEYTDEL